MKRLTAFVLSCLILASCSSEVDPTIDRDACLWEAVRAYPSWNVSNGPLLEHIPLCKGQDSTQIRQLMLDFVIAANVNSAGEN